MKRFKGTVIFIISFLIILALDFALYKNIDIFLPTHEKELYVFANDSRDKQDDFLIEMYNLFEMQNNCKPISDLNIIRDKEILYSLIRNNIYEGYSDNQFESVAKKDLYVGELSNTIYGDLKLICVMTSSSTYKKTHYLVIYSEDMKKIFYLDVNQEEYTNTLVYVQDEYDFETTEIENLTNEKSKTEIVNKCELSFSALVKDYEFEPDTIVYRKGYYILKDNTKDIAVYYNDTDNIVVGFYIGFDK